MAAKKPTMAQAYKAAQKSTAAKPKDKGIVGEGKDVLKAAGNSVKQQAEFVGAVGKGAAKGAGAVAKGAGKVAGKVANITIGDIASAPLDIAKNAAKGAAKVGKVLATPAGGSMLIQRAAMPKKPKAKSDSLETKYAQAQKASAMAQSSMKPFTGTSSPSGSTRFATAMKNREKLNSAMNLRDKKAREKKVKGK